MNLKPCFSKVVAVFTVIYMLSQPGGLFANEALWSNDTLIDRLHALPGVTDVKRLPARDFNDKYVLYIEQPLDHSNVQAGTFRQRVFLMNVSFDRPTVLVTEGYGASYAQRPTYREEISRMFNTNIVFVEHRYFLESTPEGAGWEYLTAQNSAYDLHRVREIFGELYQQKWIATGISKGGQTALLYTAWFPEDVDITVPYVAPLCKAKEDGRHEPFLRETAGTKEEREKLEAFQREVLSRRAELQPKFDSLCVADKFEFSLPTSHIYDYSVLEFPFAFWQWGSPIEEVPEAGAPANEVFKYWMKISSPSYFVHESSTTSFFVQASRELGYYGYDTKPFKGMLAIKNAKGYLDKIFVPEDAQYRFDKALYRKLKRFVSKTDNKMMFIYGEYDPWSAVKVNEPKSDNVVLFVQPKGSHRARISTLPQGMKQEAVGLLQKWLDE
ncbi:MAG: S28 family serine protease [Bacteroidales bacterium]|nr:S28 family serine protease [Bacteroidales bacterium]MDD3843509.1 S28 family serine protease [Bacteroidales bacterium]MDD4617877.1 S28 family serine protease [Bacteroidales bacterium]